MQDTIVKNFKDVFEADLLQELSQIAILKSFDENEILMDIGQYIQYIPILISGAIKIIREDQKEGEIVLYYIEKGDTCAMTLTCCLGQKQSQIRSIVEKPGSMILVPVSKMDEWLVKYKSWRNFVLNSYNNRMHELLGAIDSLAFMNMEERLLKLLNEKANIYKSNRINNTHQELAEELNTSRVVISRVLKTLENKNIIRLNRKYIEIISNL